MFGEDFKRRTKIESIAEFILSGNESTNNADAVPLEAQYSRLEKAFIQSLKNMKSHILAEPWDKLDDEQAQLKLDNIISPAFFAASDIQDLYFRAGLFAGAMIASQLGSLKENFI